MSGLIVTTGPNLERYEIVQYLGIVSGEFSIGTGFFSDFGAAIADLTGGTANGYSSKLGRVKSSAIDKMKENALRMGANAMLV